MRLEVLSNYTHHITLKNRLQKIHLGCPAVGLNFEIRIGAGTSVALTRTFGVKFQGFSPSAKRFCNQVASRWDNPSRNDSTKQHPI